MKLYNDNGVNKIAATVGAAPNVVILNADTGYVNLKNCRDDSCSRFSNMMTYCVLA